MASIVSIQHYAADIGPVTATGVLYLTDPPDDSFAQGSVSVEGVVQTTFMVRVDGDPISISIPILALTLTIKFDIPTYAFVARVEEFKPKENSGIASNWKPIGSFK
jgi:hypothetical protein